MTHSIKRITAVLGPTNTGKTHLAVLSPSSNLAPGFNLKTTDRLNITYQKTMSS